MQRHSAKASASKHPGTQHAVNNSEQALASNLVLATACSSSAQRLTLLCPFHAADTTAPLPGFWVYGAVTG